jgi:CheY-like chemotaxis protein
MARAILIADDLEEDIVLLQRALQKAGINNPVHFVDDGDKVVAYLAGEGEFSDREKFPLPAILFLDIHMPRMTGFQVLEWLATRAEFKELIPIVLTGQQELSHVKRAYALGARSFLSKPCRPEDIKNLVSSFGDCWDCSSDKAA